MTEYSVAFELFDETVTVAAENPLDAVYNAIEEIPAHLRHKSTGGIEVLDESGDAHWFEPVLKYEEKPDYGTESILDHD